MTLQDFFNDVILRSSRAKAEAYDSLTSNILENTKWALEPLWKNTFMLKEIESAMSAVENSNYTKEDLLNEWNDFLSKTYNVCETSTNQIHNQTVTWKYLCIMDLRNRLQKSKITD